jgi:cell division septation protein DedD
LAREAREARELEEARLAREALAKELEEMRMAREREEAARLAREAANANTRPQPAAPPQVSQPQVRGEIKIIPALPNPNNGKKYNMQVAAYSGPEPAFDMIKRLRSVGFDAVQEVNGSTYRVIVRDIPASMAYFAAQRLGAMGIRDIWIKEAQ